jgi:hypothetical protein
MMKFYGRRTYLILALVAVFCGNARNLAAQSGVGAAALSGVVTDVTKGALPGVTVTLTQVETGVVRTAVTNEIGLYRVLSLQPGSYLLTFELAGFAPVKQGPITFIVGQDLEIGVELQVAGISSEVTVSGGTPLVEVTKTQVSSYVTGRQIDSLPVNGRTLNDFVLLTPGVVSSGTTGFGGGTSSQNLSVGGTASTQTAQNIDGANADDQFYAAPRNDYSQEAVQEFQVITNSFPAEFGRASGGVVNIYLKSGTNTFKGGGYGYFRDDALDATDSITKSRGLANPPFFRRQWGGSLGGPIRKNKTFFFATGELQNYERTTVTSSDADIAAALGLSAASGNITAVDKYTKFTSKADHNLGNNSQLILRYDYFDSSFVGDTTTFGSVGPGLDHPSSFSKRLFTGHTAFAGWNATVRSNILNELRLRYNRFDDIRQSPQDQPANVHVNNVGNYFYNWRAADYVNRRSLGFTNNMSFSMTKHSVKVGFDYQRETDEWNYDAYRKPEIIFANKAAFFANTPQSMIIGFGDTLIPNDNNILAAYIQDQYRVTTKLTINAGLRYDLEAYRRAFPLDPKTDTNHIGPRLGVAYAVTPRTAFHAAGGVFYGQIFGSLLQNNRQAQSRRQYTLDAATSRLLWLRYGNKMDTRAGTPTEAEVLALPGIAPRDLAPGVAAPNLDSPYSYQASIGGQHQLGANFAVKASYMYVGSRHEGVGRDVNYAPPLVFAEGQVMPNGLIAPPGGGYFYNRSNLIDRTYNRINFYEPRGYSDYHGVAVTLQRRFSKSYGFEVSYTGSVAKGNGEQFGGTTIPDAIDYDYGYAANHTPHRLVANGLWDTNSSIAALRDWQISAIYVYQSGRTANVVYDSPASCFGLIGCQIRPPQYAERGSFTGEPSKTVDFRVARSFGLGGGRKLQLSADLFNVFNWEQFAVSTGYGTYPWRVNADGSIPAMPDFNLPGAGATFGTKTRVINQVRQAQLGVRFTF